jgi:phage shock protein E
MRNGEARLGSDPVNSIRLARWAWVLMIGCATAAAEPLWIDVRSPAEFANGHVAGAVNIPYLEVAVRIGEMTHDFDADIRVYCAVGVRAQIAKIQLESLGYRKVVNAGAYADIEAADSPRSNF